VNAGLRTEDANPDLLSVARLTKSDDEAAAVRRVSLATVEALAELRAHLESLRPDGEHFRHQAQGPVLLGDLRKLLQRAFLQRGLAEDGESIIAQGRDAGVPHNRGNDAEPLRAGASIIVDIFPGEAAGGYHSDMTRTFCMGRAPAPLRKVYDDVRAAFDQAMQSLKVGELCRDYQERTCDLFEARGHATIRANAGVEEGYVHGLGHGVGLAVHEAPRLGGPVSNTARLAPRMVITVEPGLYYPSKGMGVRIEDLVYVRPDGSMENLTPAPYDLEILPRG
jgi:Xaa-Pro aminopeptidase